MFWKFNLLTSSHIDALLDKEDVTLHELMDEDDVLQECKAQNRKLVDFITLNENMEELVKLITTEPANDVDEKIQFKYPNTACELLTSDVPQINEKLAKEENLVNRLYSFLEGDKPLNPLLASFFSKVMGLLITRKSEMIFEYLKSRNDFVGKLLHHIGTSAVMDLLLRLITCIESSETRRNVIEWLNTEKIVEKLVNSIVADQDEDIHCNAAQSLCDIVRLGREQFIQQHDTLDPDPLLTTMEREETVAELLSRMFDSDKNESVLVNGLCVIHTLLEIRRTEPIDQLANGEVDRFTQGLNSVIAAIVPRLKNFHDLLINPPKQRYNTMPMSIGCLEPPLGNTRLQVAKLVTALVGANMHQVNVELASLGAIVALLDLCFKYEWNNFLHTQVEQCLLTIVNSGPSEVDGQTSHPLLTQLFVEYNLIQRLLSEWEDNEQQQKSANGRRRGFMGHLTRMVNSISGLVECTESTNLVRDHFIGLPQDIRDRWAAFVSGSLAEVNKKNATELMRGHPLASSSEDDDTEFKDIPFPQDTAMQQAFSDYQLQQMTSNFIDQFGFNDEEFADHDDKIEAAFSERISNIDAELQASGINQPNQTLFDQACHERIQQFDNDDSDEDIWEDKHITTFNKTVSQTGVERLQAAVSAESNSSEDDSIEELDSPVRHVPAAEKMDVDTCEGTQVEPTAMDTTGSVWDKSEVVAGTLVKEAWADFPSVPPVQSGSEDNWADFTSFANFHSSTSTQGPRSSSPLEMETQDNIKGNSYVDETQSQGKGDSLLDKQVSTEDIVVEVLPENSPDLHQQTLPTEDIVVEVLPENSPDLHQQPDPDGMNNASSSSTSSMQTQSNHDISSVSGEARLVGTAVDVEAGSSATYAPLVLAGGAAAAGGGKVSCAATEAVSPLINSDTTQASPPPPPPPPPPSQPVPELHDGGSMSSPASPTEAEVPPPSLSPPPPVEATVPPPLPPVEVTATVPPPPVDSAVPTSGETEVPPTEVLSLPSPTEAAEPSPPILTDSDSMDVTTMSEKIEQARAKAKEALELYDAVTTVVHNGPV